MWNQKDGNMVHFYPFNLNLLGENEGMAGIAIWYFLSIYSSTQVSKFQKYEHNKQVWVLKID